MLSPKQNIIEVARILFHEDISRNTSGYLSVKLKNGILVTRFGASFETLIEDDILLLDDEGNVLEGKGHTLIHLMLSQIYKSNPECEAIIHTHSPYVINFSSLKIVPEFYDVHSCILAGDIVTTDWLLDSFTDIDENLPLIQALKRAPAVIMTNHGSITTGETIQIAALRMLALERVARRHIEVAIAANATGHKAHAIENNIVLKLKQELLNNQAFQVAWHDLSVKYAINNTVDIERLKQNAFA